MSFDLARIPSAQAASEAGFEFEARFPDGSGTGAYFTVRGPDSAAARAYANRRFAELQAREAAARRQGREPEPARADELEDQLIELAVTYTVTWRGVLDGGVELACRPETARRLYREQPWLRGQVVQEAQQLGNFVRPSSGSSSSTPAPNSGSI